jgi:alginate O-acetyltransferase complex protein AlgJ
MRLASIRSKTRTLTVVTFFAAVLLPVFLLGYNGPWLGPGDYPSFRGRAYFPRIFSPDWFGMFDEWFAVRLGFRYPLIYVGTSFHLGVLGRSLDRHIFFGRDGWMFWTDDRETVPAIMADSRGKLQFKPEEIRRIDALLRATRDSFAACGIPSAIVVAPNKQSIYGEFLLDAEAGVPQTRFDALMDALSDSARAMIIDPRPIMQAAKIAHAPVHLFNKTETHWNDLGAFYAYSAIIGELARAMQIAHLERASLDNYRVTVERYAGGDMATRVLFAPWRFADENVSVTPRDPIPGGRVTQLDRTYFVSRNPAGTGRLVLFGDSFAFQVMPFLAQHFEEVHHYVDEAFNGSIVARHRADAVLLLMVERYANRLLLPQIDLARACENRPSPHEMSRL